MSTTDTRKRTTVAGILRRWAGTDYVWLSAFLLACFSLYFSGNLFAEAAFRIPPPAMDVKDVAAADASGSGGHRTMVVAGGCFWASSAKKIADR